MARGEARAGVRDLTDALERASGADGQCVGRSDPLRGGKFSTWDGGSRVPFIIWGPGRIPAGVVSDEIVSSMDIFPSFATLAEIPLKPEHTRGPIDGHDLSDFFLGKTKTTTRDEIMFYTNQGYLQGFRKGDYKIRTHGGPQLYAITKDPGETNNLYKESPEHIERFKTMHARMKEIEADWKTNSRDRGRL